MRRVAELDALRGLAALAVMFYHLRPQDRGYGWPRVDLFLVLSGYLITSLILKYGGSRKFYGTLTARLALRVWPIYFLNLLALVAVNPLLPKPFPLDGLPNYLTFTQNIQRYWSGEVPAFNWYYGHTWSLAVEQQFYLIWPILIALAGRAKVVPLAATVLAVSVSARFAGFHPWLLLARADGFALGGMLAAFTRDADWLARHRAEFRLALAAIALAALTFLVSASIAFGGNSLTRTEPAWPGPTILATNLLYAGAIGLVVLHAGHPALGVLRARPLAYLGSISYGMYIYHSCVFITIAMTARGLGVPQGWALELLMLGATIALAALSWQFLERPILRLKERLPYGPPVPEADRDADAVRPWDRVALPGWSGMRRREAGGATGR